MSGLPDAAVKALAEALVRYETSGTCTLGQECPSCDCGLKGATPQQLRENLRHEMARARFGLADAVPHLTTTPEPTPAETEREALESTSSRHLAGPDDQCANPECSRCWGPDLLVRPPRPATEADDSLAESLDAMTVTQQEQMKRTPAEQAIYNAAYIKGRRDYAAESQAAARPATVSEEVHGAAIQRAAESVDYHLPERVVAAILEALTLTAQPEADVRADEREGRCLWCRIGQHAHCESPELLPCTCGHAETTKDAVSRGETMAEVLDRYAEGSVEQRWVVDDVRAAIARTAPAHDGSEEADHG